MSGVNIVGVQFRRAGKIYDFNAKNLLLAVGDRVVVETERGPSLAEVKRISYVDSEGRDLEALKPVVRIATKKDIDAAGRLTAEDAERFAREKIKELNLDMRLIGAEIQFGGNKAILFFSAPGRVDFRELVKELASGLKTRVELKQVGARDEAKQIGGIGICGREFCCSSFLREFVPVSIKMAKNQNLALNPSKVSGGCGRLLCCLTYEDETYRALRQRLLPKRTRVRLPDGTLGDVVKGDILNQTMLIETDQGEQISIAIDKLEVVERGTGVQDDDWGEDLDLGALMGDEEFPVDAPPPKKVEASDEESEGDDDEDEEDDAPERGPSGEGQPGGGKRRRNRRRRRRGGGGGGQGPQGQGAGGAPHG